MRRAWVAVLFLPLASGQVLLEDPAGDVEWASYGQSVDPVGDWSPVDLRFMAIEETADELFFTVGVERLATCEGGQCYNAGDLRTYFRYGQQWYYVQQGMDPIGNAYGQLHIIEEGQVNGPTVHSQLGATFDLEAQAVRVAVPRELVVDESGTPPIRDRLLGGFHTRSYSQYSLGGPEVQGSDDMLVIRDRMGFDATMSYGLRFGGGSSEGPVRFTTEAPFRASNGGAATYRYDLSASWEGPEGVRFNVSVADLPDRWTFERPSGQLVLEPGETQTFPVLITTPSGHEHGGADTFSVRLDAADAWAELQLGVHYLQIPQPAGHHPVLYLHTLTDGAFATALAVLGNDDGRIWMNTLEEDPGDEGVPVVGQEGLNGFQQQTTRWSICMIPNLRLGLDFDLTRTGLLEVPIGASTPHLGIVVTGQLLHLDGPDDLDFCDPRFYADRTQTVLATMASEGEVDLTNQVDLFELVVEPTPESDLVPFQEGAQLILELEATYTGGDPGPGGLSIHPGGRLRLPLLEYADDRPAGFVDGSAQDETVQNGTLGAFEGPAPVTDAPGWPVLPLLAVLAILARRR